LVIGVSEIKNKGKPNSGCEWGGAKGSSTQKKSLKKTVYKKKEESPRGLTEQLTMGGVKEGHWP